MAAIDVLISNGTCYYAADKEATSNIIPCGNSAAGIYQCCEEGDYCLDFNICYNEDCKLSYS